MYPYLGDFPVGTTNIFFPFHTFDSNGASVTMTGLAVTDIEVYRDASMTQRASDNGYALVDTDGTDIDGFVGIHGLTIDVSDNSTAGFYAAGHEYIVVVSAVSIESQTVRFIVGAFSIERAGGVLELIKNATFGLSALNTKINTIDDFLDTEIAAILAAVDTEVAAILAAVDDIGTAGAGLTAIPWNAAWDAEVQSEVNDALVVLHLDHLLAVDYDPASKPGVSTALLNEIIESDSGVSRFSANALEQGPSGSGASSILSTATAQAGGASTITLANTEPTTVDLYKLCSIAISGGTGVGQSRQILSGNVSRVQTVNVPWVIVPDNTSVYKIFGNNGIDAATLDDIAGAVHGADPADYIAPNTFGGEGYPANLKKISDDTLAADNAELFFDGSVLALANVTIGHVTALTGHTAQTGDAYARLGAPVGASVSADLAAVKSETALIVADTNELQTDWHNGGRLDLLIDGVATSTALGTVSALVSATLANIAIVDGIVDLIKLKTDGLSFTLTGRVDANSLFLNSQPVAGGGAERFRRG